MKKNVLDLNNNTTTVPTANSLEVLPEPNKHERHGQVQATKKHKAHLMTPRNIDVPNEGANSEYVILFHLMMMTT